MPKTARLLLIFNLLALSSTANALEFCGKKAQGEIILARSGGNEQLFAFGRDADLLQTITVGDETKEIEIAATKWDIQDIKGLPPKKVAPSKEDEKEINREYADVRNAQKASLSQTYWKKGFLMPVEGRISGAFGGQRIMNGEKRNPHMGVDIAAPEGTTVMAPSDGVVTLAGQDYFFSGNVIVINHGHNLFTIYAHLKDMNVKKGDKVKQGDIIATVGKTGRATGAHLHWGASLGGTRFNPVSLLELDKCL